MSIEMEMEMEMEIDQSQRVKRKTRNMTSESTMSMQSCPDINLSPGLLFSKLLTKASAVKISLCSRFIWRPLCFIIVLVLSSLTIARLCLMTRRIEREVNLEARASFNRSLTEFEKMATLLPPLNLSVSHLARALSSYLNGTELTFPSIQTKVAPTLFLALASIPHLSQVSYIGVNGLLFSYHGGDDQTFATYANTSFSSFWHTQPVDRDTGQLYGEAFLSQSMISANDSWFQEALNRSTGFAVLGNAWNEDRSLLIHYITAMDGRGLVILTMPAKVVSHFFSSLELRGGDLFLASVDGKVIIPTTLRDTQMVINNNTALMQTLKPNGDVKAQVGNFSCAPNDGDGEFPRGKIDGIDYIFHCSSIEIMGIESVYMLSYPSPDLASPVHNNITIFLTLLVLVFVFMVISFAAFIMLLMKATKREMRLCASLIKQKNATLQAERKSMNKTQAFANASHDVRASLAAITGLIDICQEDVKPDSHLAANLVQMDKCTKDLLGILNTVLDTSRIEAKKIQLEDEEFNLAELLEDVVNLFYPLGVKKGVDVLLDPCDDSVNKTPFVRGDRGRLKQVLCNLLSNAVNFTSEGHIAVRARMNRASFQNKMIARNHKCLSWLFYKNKGGSDELDALRTVEQNPDCMEFIFEVDDTGQGIPKEKQKDVFEYFVQVKESAQGQEGCGLGLGIVQSLVRLMGGEIEIVSKAGARGTCFRVTIFLRTCRSASADADEESEIPSSFGRTIWPPSQGSQVILIISGDERRRTLKRYIGSLNIKVTAKKPESFLQNIETIMYRLDNLNNSASTSSDAGVAEGPSSTRDGSDISLPSIKKSNSKGSAGLILLVVDVSAGLFSELYTAVASMRKGLQNSRYRVVWLDNPFMRNSHLVAGEADNEASDYVVYQPLHGSHLMDVLKLLPEIRGCTSQSKLPKLQSMAAAAAHGVARTEEADTRRGKGLQSAMDTPTADTSHGKGAELAGTEPGSNALVQTATIGEKPLNGKRVLVVDDEACPRKLTVNNLHKLGATVEVCKDGKEALDEVVRILRAQTEEGHRQSLPYDFILMDCKMLIMDGYEATRMIRMEEQKYGIHTPIIALTATMDENAKKSYLAGMDAHLAKPLRRNKLMDLLRSMGIR